MDLAALIMNEQLSDPSKWRWSSVLGRAEMILFVCSIVAIVSTSLKSSLAMETRYHNERYRAAFSRLNNNNRRHNQCYNFKESNLSRFKRECRERDLRKIKRIANRFKSTNHDHFAATINQLKNDAQILSSRIQKKKANQIDKESRRHSMGFTCNYPNVQSLDKENVAPIEPMTSKMSNVHIQPPPFIKEEIPTPLPIQELPQNITRRENTQIFFEHKQYYSSLHSKYNMNVNSKSNIHSVYNYFDSLRNDEVTLKNKLRTKWQELKKDVDKTFHSFNKRKSKKQCNKSTIPAHVHSTKEEAGSFDILTNILPSTEPAHVPPQTFIHSNKEDDAENEQLDKIMDGVAMLNDQKDQESQIIDVPGMKSNVYLHMPEQKEENIIDDVVIESVPPQVNENEANEDPTHSTIYCVSHLQKSNEYWDFSVRQLKEKLLSMHVSIDQCIEKRDLIQKLKMCKLNKSHEKHADILTCTASNVNRPKQQNQSVPSAQSKSRCKNRPSILFDSLLQDTRESKQQITNRADLFIHRWSYRRSFRQILNSVLDYKAGDRRYIARGKGGDQNYALMMKCYKKAIFLIHPDKHVHSCFEVKYKAAEMFKIMTSLCDKYRKKHAVK